MNRGFKTVPRELIIMNGRFKEILRELMDRDNYSIADVAKGTGISKGTIGHWLTGVNPTNPVPVRELAIFLNVPFEYLVFGNIKTHETTILENLPTETIVDDYCHVIIRKIKSFDTSGKGAKSINNKSKNKTKESSKKKNNKNNKY